MTVASISLNFQAGTSNKVYKVVVTMQDGIYTLTGHWGRLGDSLQSQVKGTYDFHWDAVREMYNLAGTKQKKGYSVTERVAV